MSSKLTGGLESLKMNFKKSNAVVQHTELNSTVKYSDQGVIRFELKPITIGGNPSWHRKFKHIAANCNFYKPGRLSHFRGSPAGPSSTSRSSRCFRTSWTRRTTECRSSSSSCSGTSASAASCSSRTECFDGWLSDLTQFHSSQTASVKTSNEDCNVTQCYV